MNDFQKKRSPVNGVLKYLTGFIATAFLVALIGAVANVSREQR